jgi:nitronate monooxygenase
VVIEGPLAGGHLGFGMDWAQYDLATIVTEIAQFLKTEQLGHSADRRWRHLHRQ